MSARGAQDIALVVVVLWHGLGALPERASNLGGVPPVLALVRMSWGGWGGCGVFTGAASRCHPKNLVATKSGTGMVEPLVLEKKHIRSRQAIECR